MRLQGLRPAVVASLCLLFQALPAPATAQLRVTGYVSGLSSPLGFVQDPSDAALQYVVEQGGRIKVVSGGVLQATPFLDLVSPAPSMVVCCGEEGLLGLAFPPNYGTSRQFYVYFTPPGGNIVVTRFTRSASNRLVADRTSRFDLRWSTGEAFIRHPTYSNHNGGGMAFGADGMLYVATGDGGSGGDPNNNAQNTSVLLGKVLRIDVTSAAAQASANGFVVPAGNPGLPRPEIWSYGWRNPWRLSFDMGTGGTGAMLVGDVGQGIWEEIDYEPANRPGRNYGWRYREGAHTYTGTPPTSLVLTEPLFDYHHNDGRSVTGGYVYRGSSFPDMRGRYIFGDYVTRRVWSVALTVNGTTGEATASDLKDHTAELAGGLLVGNISSFGVDSRGEMYLVDHSRGLVLKFSRGAPEAPTGFRVIR